MAVIDIDTDDSFMDADEIVYTDGVRLADLVAASEAVVNPDGSVTFKPNPSGSRRVELPPPTLS